MLGVGAPGDGVRGFALGPTPAGHGVAGETNSPNLSDAGVAGEAGRGGVGVKGESQRGSGIGVHGLGSNQAVRGEGGSFGVVGTGTATGVDGTGRFGIVGRATATGVDGAGTGPSSFGVVGVGGVAGVWGGNPTRGGIGVVGVSGPISGGIIPFAGRFTGPVMVAGPVTVFGPVSVTGAKSALIPHPDGSHRAMYAVEAPDSWFEDVGRAQLHQGVARVEIDPDFAAVSGLGDDYHVFLTPEGPSNGLYVTGRSPGGFEVREQGEGNAEISFSYRIMTPRTDIRTKRLEPIELPSETGVRATEPAEPPAVPSPDSPEEPGEAPPAELLPEGAVPEPPSDWPEAVPWPPDIMRNWDTR